MALLTRGDICEMYGLTQSYLSVNAGRKKLVITKTGDGKQLIDTNHEVNVRFFSKKKKVKELEQVVFTPEPIQPAQPKIDYSPTIITTEQKVKEAKEKVINLLPNEPVVNELLSISDIEKKKKLLDIQLLEEKIGIEKMKKQKMEGELIPVKLVENLVSATLKAFTNSFYQTADSLSNTIVTSLGGTREDIIEVRKKLRDEVNIGIRNGKKIATKQVDVIVEEFQYKK